MKIDWKLCAKAVAGAALSSVIYIAAAKAGVEVARHLKN